MGYYSDVRLITTRKGYDKLSKFLKNELTDISDNMIENCDFKSVHHNTVFMGWNNIKWYEYSDFKDVDSLIKGMNYLDKNKYSFHFARMGESYDDYEENDVDHEEDELDVYSSVDRSFDDDYVMKELEREDKYYKQLKEKGNNNDLLQN